MEANGMVTNGFLEEITDKPAVAKTGVSTGEFFGEKLAKGCFCGGVELILITLAKDFENA